MNLRNRQQALTLLALVAVALLAGDRLLLSPLLKAWKERSARLVTLQRSVTQGETLLTRANELRQRWSEFRTNTFSTEPSVAQNQLLKAFDRWSRESGAGVTAIKPQWKQPAKDHALVECRVDAYGNLSTLSRFLYNIEQDPLAVKVEAIELTARDDNGEQLTLGLQVSGLILNVGRTP